MTEHIQFSSRTYNVPVDNIDTDQIIPAKFLTTTDREGMGRFCFHDWRFNQDGSEKADHHLASYSPERCKVLVTGTNFGCGSSREHAPWALLDFGIRAVISSSFADIFRGNALKNGLLPISVDQEVIDFLLAHHDHPVTIDVPGRTISIEGLGEFTFPLDPFSGYCLTRGIDQLDYILQNEEDIGLYEHRNNK